MNEKTLPRGMRNRNPGNIRRSATKYLGEVAPSRDAAFKQFETMAWGYRAMFVLLDSYSRKGYRTIRQMISRYAPPIENHTKLYPLRGRMVGHRRRRAVGYAGGRNDDPHRGGYVTRGERATGGTIGRRGGLDALSATQTLSSHVPENRRFTYKDRSRLV